MSVSNWRDGGVAVCEVAPGCSLVLECIIATGGNIAPGWTQKIACQETRESLLVTNRGFTFFGGSRDRAAGDA
jgi:hypothetical protein